MYQLISELAAIAMENDGDNSGSKCYEGYFVYLFHWYVIKSLLYSLSPRTCVAGPKK